ncbi:hypothetical protein [Ktedonospora formicarum]|uniref:hypothetical protein n=1 Tax=Ktedonospora formicarum TaxID=2778364 RepID=UPI001C6942E9|nr:hypothetical protein [Ktedonospora formicarum]
MKQHRYQASGEKLDKQIPTGTKERAQIVNHQHIEANNARGQRSIGRLADRARRNRETLRRKTGLVPRREWRSDHS